LKPDPNKLLYPLTLGDLESVLKKYTNTWTQRSFRIIFSAFFGWAVRHHSCVENPCKRLDKLPKEMSQIATLSITEVKRLLFAAVRLQDGSAAAAVAIGILAGLRPSETKTRRSPPANVAPPSK
jgi:integrase